MPINWFINLVKSAPKSGKPTTDAGAGRQAQQLPETQAAPQPLASYPPVDRGLALRTPQELLASNHALFDRLRLHAATDAARFEERYSAPLLRLAAHVNAVPGSASGIFAGEGGLFRAAIEMAFFSFQASDGRIFTGEETVERRHALESRWRYVCFLAGMLYPIGRCLDSLVVVSEQGQVWKKHHMGITDWAASVQAERIFATWGEAASDVANVGPSSYTSGVLSKLVGPENLQWLEDGSGELVKALYDICSGQASAARNAQDVIISMWEKVTLREEARRPQSYGRMTVGTHLGPYLAGTLSALVEQGRWRLNEEAIMADASGLYLVWPRAAQDIIAYGREQGYVGWPANASTIAELLKTAGVVEASTGDDLGLCELVAEGGEIVKAYRIRNPLSVIEDFDPGLYTRSSPLRLDAVLQSDPIESASSKKTRAQATAKGHKESSLSHQTSAVTVDDSEEAQAPGPRSQHEAPETCKGQGVLGLESAEALPVEEPEQAPNEDTDRNDRSGRAPAPKVDLVTAVADDSPAIKEAQEVRYSDLVPDEVRKDIRRGLSVELLGKVIKAWKSRGENSKTMRMTDDGAAIALEYLSTIVRDPPKWVGEMAEAGLIYSPPSKPGLKIIKVAIPEGAKPRESIVLSRYAVKKLGL